MTRHLTAALAIIIALNTPAWGAMPDCLSQKPETTEPAQQLAFARMLDAGLCGRPYKKEAEAWYRKAAEQGEMMAEYALADTYFSGDGVPIDYVEAKKWYLKAARQGHGPSQLRLGFLYAEKHFTGEVNYAEAEKWFYLAARQDADDARFRLGNFYINTKRPPNMEWGLGWLRHAARGGHSVAMYDLFRYLEQDAPKEAVKYLKQSAKAGYGQAQTTLYEALVNGRGTIKPNNKQAVDVLLAIVKGPSPHPRYLSAAGDAFFEGKGAPKNYPAARGYYERAEAKGDLHAAERLATIYKDGLGVPKDAAKSAAYAAKAAGNSP
ncbi:MAG: hypothetical protein ACAH80_16710 [Alphaproteobacteria bacterium]